MGLSQTLDIKQQNNEHLSSDDATDTVSRIVERRYHREGDEVIFE